MAALSHMRLSTRILLALLLVLGVMEASVRVYQFARGRTFDDALYGSHYRDYVFLGTSFKPGSTGAWQGVSDLEVNSMGFRGDEFPIAKPSNEFRIITFGASTSHSGNYPGKLQKLLAEGNAAGKKIKVINAAVPTWNTTQSLIQFITRATYLSPDLIVIYHAINDASQVDNKWLTALPAVDYTKFSGPLENSSLLYVLVRSKVRAVAEVIKMNVFGIAPIHMDQWVAAFKGHDSMANTQIFRSNLESFSYLAKRRNIQVAFLTMPLSFEASEDMASNRRRAGAFYATGDVFVPLVKKVALHNDIIRGLAKAEGAHLVDVAATSFSKDAANFVDLCHFSEAGAQRFAEIVAASLREILPKPNGS